MYEKKRLGSYVFFAIGVLILLWFFPQPIAIPCILCACFADPLMGEIRTRFSERYVYFFGFLVCFFFFMVSYYKAELFLMILSSVIGAYFAVIGETKKFLWIDDDFMIQILPAVFLLLLWYLSFYSGWNLPGDIIITSSIPN